MVLEAGHGGSAQGSVALAKLCQTYWQPLYAYVRRLGHNPADAEDLTQEFFARLIEKNFVENADAEKGRFRSFLLTALKRFLANEWDKQNREKRGGGREVISLDARDAEDRFLAEPADDQTPVTMFERQWAVTLLDQVLTRLETEFSDDGKQGLFDALKTFLIGEKSDFTYTELGVQLSLTEGAVKVSVHRMRQRYRELLRNEIAHTVSSPQEIADELRHLFAALSV
jgi:RNA polymerase sigma-70 factor (ECF subfamily)